MLFIYLVGVCAAVSMFRIIGMFEICVTIIMTDTKDFAYTKEVLLSLVSVYIKYMQLVDYPVSLLFFLIRMYYV